MFDKTAHDISLRSLDGVLRCRLRTPGSAIVPVTLAALLTGACTSSVDPAPISTTPPVNFSNANLNVGFFPGVDFSANPIGERAAAGAVIQGSHDSPDRSVVFMAFTTAADASTLAFERPLEGNGATDVFVAAIVDQDVNFNAFSYSLAGKMRSPRCVTCHSVASTGNTPFVNGGGSIHPLDLTTVDVTDPTNCADCHNSSDAPSLAASTPDWKAPDASFDFKGMTLYELNDRARIPPDGSTFHFFDDQRVSWALSNGHLPSDQVADDNRNGIAECEDYDRVLRTVPGGENQFLTQVLAWSHGGFVADTSRALKDVVLASQVDLGLGGQSGNAASSAPSLTYVANPAFDHDQPWEQAAGFLYVAFATDATDLVPGFVQSHRDVVRVTIEVWMDRDPRTGAYSPNDLDLRFQDSGTVLASDSAISPGLGGNADSRAPSINADGSLIAYESLATDLGTFFEGNTAGQADVFVRKIGGSGFSRLVSRSAGSATQGAAGGSSSRPAISADGTAIAFESLATNIVAPDTNARADIFFVRIDAATGDTLGAGSRASVATGGTQGIGGDSRNASIAVDAAGDVIVAFESDKTNLGLPAPLAVTNVYLHRPAVLETDRLSQVYDAAATATVGNGDSRAPRLDDAGTAVVFETDANNLDELRPVDVNHATDIVRADLSAWLAGTGFPRLHRLSLTANGTDADAGSKPGTQPSSTAAAFGVFRGPKASVYGSGFVVFTTAADNLGAADTDGTMIVFARETVSADPVGIAPVLSFQADVTSGFLPLAVNFTSSDAQGSATSWCWDFGDGSLPSKNSLGQNPALPHLYTTAGTYTVTLTARWDGGAVTTRRSAYIRVDPPVVPPTWSQVYLILAANCTSCHGNPPTGGAPFSMATQTLAYNEMVNIPSVNLPCAGVDRVEPFDSAQSVLINRISGTSCGPMMGNLSADDVSALAAWIDDGAQNN